ncbi:MAG TPA: dienelactone hydrolase family protein [Candidatus Hydrogenedentes bacterium]|nr:dienelactone hydrolase family protein [Candidatus Hydrogenedentota bacterium]HQE83974.1 dienelactone hydrolase family protein [Candidatus Hydrogenedentota bacterium]HQH54506.1 dienelactone hydrolase family protein [Candidatus Hydrogenedentota bacterium]HQM50611.1 dienelactone hydrolase family protein [Candidatus Hydrogenedentota bacterium]
MVDLNKLKNPLDWIQARKEIESAVLRQFGKLPKERAELQLKVMDEESFSGYVRRRVNYFVTEWERITAWLFLPERKDPAPAIVCCHSETPEGKAEPAGLAGDRFLAFAQHYAEQGFATIAPDCVTTGERVSPGRDAYDTTNFYKDWPKASLLGKMMWDYTCALEALAETPGVDAARMGIIGHGLGGTCALLVAALDERVQVCVASCGFTRFQDDKKPGRWVQDGECMLLPNLEEAVATRNYPFDWEHILALAAPTPTLLITALNDEKLSNTKSCQKAADAARNVYRMLGAENAIENWTHARGRSLTVEALDAADAWFERWI